MAPGAPSSARLSAGRRRPVVSVLQALALLGCAHATHVAPAAPPRGAPAVRVPSPSVAALHALCDAVVRPGLASVTATRTLGITLAQSNGARTVTGDAATDDVVSEALVVTWVEDTASVLVTTACGDAKLVSLRWDGEAWRTVDHAVLVGDAHPGACRSTEVHADARAMLGDLPREIVVSYGSASEEADSVRAPVLRVYALTPTGTLQALSGEIPFGGTDDTTGATQRGEWTVDEVLQSPRDLYIQLMPGRAGPGGAALPEIIRRTYHIVGGVLTLTDETHERVRLRNRTSQPSCTP